RRGGLGRCRRLALSAPCLQRVAYGGTEAPHRPVDEPEWFAHPEAARRTDAKGARLSRVQIRLAAATDSHHHVTTGAPRGSYALASGRTSNVRSSPHPGHAVVCGKLSKL